MPRLMLAAIAAAFAAATAAGAAAQDGQSATDTDRQINAAEYIRGLLQNDRYDPRARERARNYAPEIEAGTHWRSSIFDGRRTRSTRGTGLRPLAPIRMLDRATE